jgi:stearoyl-CoA desaturase (delta-9 desaturase)
MSFNNLRALRILQQINFWTFVPSIVLLFYVNDWIYFVACITSIVLITKVGISIAQHRYFTHRSFETTAVKHKLLILLGALSTTGTVIQYAVTHRHHHAKSDTVDDIHSPNFLSGLRVWFQFYPQENLDRLSIKNVKDLIRDPLIMLQHKYYLLIIAAYIILLAVVDPLLILFCYVIPCGYTMLNVGLTSYTTHLKNIGYRNFDISDDSRNNTLVNWITLGEGLHNNHHAKPSSYTYAFTDYKYEWDFTAWLIKTFLMKS